MIPSAFTEEVKSGCRFRTTKLRCRCYSGQSTICWHCTTLTTLLLIQHTGSTAQMERFLTSVGCKLGWDHTPYEMVDHKEYLTKLSTNPSSKPSSPVSNRRFPVDHREKIHQFESRIRFDTEILTLICVLFESATSHFTRFTIVQLQHLYDHQLANVRIFVA
jgi:hypothetical protein